MNKLAYILVIFTMFSCASTRVVVEPASFDYNNEGLEHTYVRAGAAKELYIGEFEDNRKTQGLGTVATGIMNEPTKVEMKNKFSTVFSDELTKILIKKGMNITPKKDSAYEAFGSVTKFELWEAREDFNAQFTSCVAEVEFKVRDIKANTVRWKASFKLEHRTSGSFMDSTHKTSLAAIMCLNGIAEKLIHMEKFQKLVGFDLVK